MLLEVEEHDRFIRQGPNLAVELPVTFAQVALGDRIEIEGLDQTVAVDIPSGTQSGQVLRLRGQGVPDLESGKRGDLLVHLRVWTPENLTSQEEEAIRALRDVSQAPPEKIEVRRWTRVLVAVQGRPKGVKTPDRWLRLEVELPAGTTPDEVYELTEALVEAGSSGTEQGTDRCVTYFPPPGNLDDFKATAEARIAQVLGATTPCGWAWQPHEEWAELWRQGFTAHDFGTRLRVAPPWVNTPLDDSREVVLIDPGLAFGTAEHGSTRSCLHFIEGNVRRGDTVLDVGAGSGVLAIAAVRLGAISAVCVEIDAMACQALHENAARNNVESAISVIESPFGEEVGTGSYDVVMCNMVRSRLLPLLSILADRVAPHGTLILGGIQATERAQIDRDLSGIGEEWSTPVFQEDTGWLAVLLTRPT